jgi:1A family penicillin-binding protein
LNFVTSERLKKTWIIIRLLMFACLGFGLFLAVTGVVLFSYAKIQGPPPLQVPQTTVFYGSGGDEIAEAEHDGQNRYWVSLDDMSESVVNATIAIEDKRFYDHSGFDFRRVAGAALADLQAMAKVEGASTITMQYARNLFLDHNKTWTRKIREALYTLRLEANYSKDTILEGYLNTIYYGHGSYGIEAAAQYYFSKHADELTLAEAGMLVAIPKGPRHYSPFYNMENAQNRQKTVLNKMASGGYITKEQALRATAQKLEFVRHASAEKEELVAPYFRKAVERILKTELGIDKETIRSGGLRVYTTLDKGIQEKAEKWAEEVIPPDSDIQAALVAMDPRTGNVKAMIGGRNFEESPYNRAIQAKRQPGSTFKPFLYYAALRQGFTPSTEMMSKPTAFAYGDGETYKPNNYGGNYANDFITFAQALALSDNVIAVKTHMFLGMEHLVDTAKKVGITSPLAKIPSLALGTKPVSVLEMVRGYSAFANGGYRIEPHFITKVVDSGGKVLYENKPEKKQVLNPQTSFVLSDMMTGIFDQSLNDYTTVTGRTINDYLKREVAGKSGTTATDSWMIGFTPKFVTGVWTGYDKGQSLDPMVETGYAKEIWGRFMKDALKDQPKEPFDPPKGVVGVYVDPGTGLLATNDCPDSRLTYYVKGTEPTEYCKDHIGDSKKQEEPENGEKEGGSWLEKLFDWF